MRRWGAFPLGDGLGGAGTHWNGVTWRNLPSEFNLRSHLEQRYGKTRHSRRSDGPGLGRQL